MSLFAIADLHLPGGQEKPMNVFGEHWDRHFEQISQSWRETVGEQVTVLIAGDISWAMQLQQAIPDLESIGLLPGKKILIRGNHDYWWSAIGRVRAALPAGMYALQQDALDIGEAIVCGTRGWTFPAGDTKLSEEDQKIYQRELIRTESALQAAQRLAGDSKPIIAMLHYPPLYDNERDTAFTALFEKYQVSQVIYGHLHAESIRLAFDGEHHGVRYRLTSCDALHFQVTSI